MQLRETETLELKKSTSELKEAMVAISAMLNKHGHGDVIFGIEDSGKAVGQDIGKTTIRDISKSINDHIEPELFPDIHEEQIAGKPCIRVKFSGNQSPYFAFGRAYMRVGDKNLVLSRQELHEMFMHKGRDALRWDSKPCPGAALSDIDQKKFGEFLKRAGFGPKSIKESLLSLGLILQPKGEITNAAILLFGKKVEKFIQNSKLRCAVFAGRATILDMKDYEGDLFSLVEHAQKYVMENIHVGEVGMEGLARIDAPEIDPAAVREAVINAFVHRDYHNPDSVHVAIFQDRVEIRSPGLLYGNLTIKRIRRGGISLRRNELLASVLQRIHFAEAWGKGIQIILGKEPKTTFEEAGMQFFTVFRRKLPAPETIAGESQKSPRKVLEKVLEKLTENQDKIMEQIMADPFITNRELSGKVSISERKIRENIRKLKAAGLLRRIGPDRGGRWEIVRGRE